MDESTIEFVGITRFCPYGGPQLIPTVSPSRYLVDDVAGRRPAGEADAATALRYYRRNRHSEWRFIHTSLELAERSNGLDG